MYLKDGLNNWEAIHLTSRFGEIRFGEIGLGQTTISKTRSS